MKKKLLTLFTLLLCAVGGANAEDVVVTYTFESSASKATMAENFYFSAAANPTVTGSGTFSSNSSMLRCTVTKSSSAVVTFTFTAKSKIRLSSFTFSSYVGSDKVKSASVDYYKNSETPVNETVSFNKSTSTDITITPSSPVSMEVNDVLTVKVNLNNTDTGTDRPWQLSTIKLSVSMLAPGITSQPVSSSYVTGATATALSVVATASSGELSYQWYSNTSASTEGATLLTGETSSSYTPSTASAGVTYYYCTVTDANGTTNSDFATITVGSAYTVTTSVNNAEYGTVTVTDTYIGGNDAVITATPNTGYIFVSWTIDGVENASTTNPYTFSSIAADHTIQAVFEAIKTVSFSVSDTNNGTRTDNYATEYCDENDKFTAPANFYLSSDNQTLTGWNDGTTTYAVGAEIDCSAGNKTLTPVFTTNSGVSFAATLDARTAGFTTTWNFGSNYAMFAMEGKTGYYVKQATINGATVDIPMYINTKPGKFNTEGDNTTRAQINNGTVLRVPVVDGSVVTLTGLYAFGTKDRNNKDCVQTTINGVTTYVLSNSNKTATYTYSGTTGTIDIVVGGDMAWGTSLSVTYPSPYSVTYDGNGAQSGSVTDVTYDANASVTTKANGFVRAGYAFAGWNTEADGSGTSYAAGEQFTITGDVTLYAQWTAGADATITYTLADVNNSSSATTITSEYSSTSDKLTESAGITNNTGAAYGSGGSKANLTVKIPTDASYNADHYMSVAFTVAAGYKFTPSSISIKAQPVTTAKTVKLVLTDGINSIEKTQENVKDGVISTITMGNSEGTTFTGNVTLKIYCYGATNTYRLGSPITITGAVVSDVVEGTISASGYNTFSSSYALDLSTISGGTAYVASSVTDGKVVLTKVADKIVPAETGLMIAGAVGETFTIGTTSDAATFTGDNLFVAQLAEGKVPVAGSGFNYVFGWTTPSDPGFYKVASDLPTLGAGKAYLHTNSELGATSARLALSFEEGETTGISATLVNSEESTVNNVFDLQGRRVAQPTKGLYIINGRKVVVK